MDVGRDPREDIFPSLGLIVSSLLAVTNSITFCVFISTASMKFVVVRSSTIVHIPLVHPVIFGVSDPS